MPLSLRSSPAGHVDPSSAQALGIVILSAVRFVRESLSEILGRDPGMTVFGHYAALDDALRETLTRRPDVFLLDAAFINGKSAVTLIRETMPQTRVVERNNRSLLAREPAASKRTVIPASRC